MKRCICLVLSLAFVMVSLAACRSGTEPETTPKPEVSQSAPASTPAPSTPRPSTTTRSATSSHQCEVCDKAGTHYLDVADEYYCDEHWEEMEAIVNMLLGE